MKERNDGRTEIECAQTFVFVHRKWSAIEVNKAPRFDHIVISSAIEQPTSLLQSEVEVMQHKK